MKNIIHINRLPGREVAPLFPEGDFCCLLLTFGKNDGITDAILYNM